MLYSILPILKINLVWPGNDMIWVTVQGLSLLFRVSVHMLSEEPLVQIKENYGPFYCFGFLFICYLKNR